jgi:hypothetical protein
MAPMKKQLLITGLSILAMGACKKKDAGAPAAGSGSAPAGSAVADNGSAAAKPAPAPATCPANAWKEPSGLFCLDPQGFTPGEVKKNDSMGSEANDLRMEVYFKKAGVDGKPDTSFNISWFPARGNTEALGAVANMGTDYKNNTGEDKGAFAGDRGKYFVFARKDNAKSHKMYAVLEGKQHAYNIEASSFDAPIDPAVIAATKSMVPTD